MTSNTDCDQVEFNICDATYSNLLIKQLHEMQKSKDFCDFCLIADRKEIQVHKVILFAVSPYFRFLSKDKFKESSESKIEFTDISMDTLEVIVNFMYTGELKINLTNVFDLMAAGNIFQMSYMKLLISHFLLSTMNTLNCLQILAYARLYRYTEIFSACLKFITKHISEVLNEKLFLDAPAEIIQLILTQPALSSTEILSTLDKWLEHRGCEIIEYSFNDCQKIDIQKKYPEFANIIISILEFMKKYYYKNNLVMNKLKEFQIILSIGGENQIGVWSNIESYNTQCWSLFLPDKDGGTVISTMLHARSCFTATVNPNNDFIYVVGGRGLDHKSVLNFCEKFDIESCKWQSIAALPKKICFHASVWFDDKVVVTGGQDEQGNILNNIWEYLPNDNCWRESIQLQEPRYGHGACNILGTLYVLGGITNAFEMLSSVERYNSDLGKWIIVSNMPQKTCFFGCVTLQQYIYIIGGKKSENFVSDKVYRYDAVFNIWTEFENMPTPKFGFGCSVLDEKIFCVGGSDIVHGPLNYIYIYNPKTNRWHYSTERLSTEKTHLSAVSFTIYYPKEDIKI